MILVFLTIIFISGCIEEDIENIPESELQEICAGESWPSDGCNVIEDLQGRQLCEKCKELLGYVKTDGEGPEGGVASNSQFSLIEGDSESWMVVESIIGVYVPSPTWFRFDYLNEGPSLRCKQFANLENAQNNVKPLGEAVVDYVGTTTEPYLFEFGERGTTFVNLVVGVLNFPPNNYAIYQGEAEEVQEDGYPIPKEGLEAEAIFSADNIVQVTSFTGEGLSADPDFSPDGRQIAFSRLTKTGEDKNGNMYIINIDGTGLTKIGHEYLYDPSWSPIDNRILCYGGEDSDLYIIDLNVDKTNAVPFGMKNSHLAIWSPDATKIAYAVYDNSNAPVPSSDPTCDGTGVLGSIWIMNSDGTGKTQLTTEEEGYCSGPSFSPDGSKIVYNKGFIHGSTPFLIHRPAHEIWVMNSDGSNKHAIYKPEASIHYMYQNAWSKNNEIMFPRIWWKRRPQIWSINSDGTNPQCLIKVPELSQPEDAAHEFMYGDVAWDKTGTKIVSTQEINPGPDIYEDCNIVIFSLE